MRVLLKRPLSDLWLDLEAPIQSVSKTSVLNGPGDISVTLPLSYLSRKAEDGKPVLLKYGTLIIVEEEGNGDSLDVALLDDVQVQGDTVTISGGGISMLSKGTPWLGKNKEYALADPVKIFHDVWNHIQSYDSANLGIKITGDTSSSGRLGVPPTPAYIKAEKALKTAELNVTKTNAELKRREANLVQKTTALFKAAGFHSVGQVKWQASAPSEKKNVIWIESDKLNETKVWKNNKWVVITNQNQKIQDWMWDESYRTLAAKNAKEAKTALTAAKEAFSKLSEEKGETYDFNWWKTHDLTQVTDELIEAGPFEYVERARWIGEDIELSIEVGSPRIGSRKEDLRFELGVNVVNQPDIDLRESYTEVFQMGAGEGSERLRTVRTLPQGVQVRRVKVQTDKDARTQQMTNRAADSALKTIRTSTGFVINTLQVINHPFAYRNQYQVGDEINVFGLLPDGSELDVWARIKEITSDGDNDIYDLKVEAI